MRQLEIIPIREFERFDDEMLSLILGGVSIEPSCDPNNCTNNSGTCSVNDCNINKGNCTSNICSGNENVCVSNKCTLHLKPSNP